MEKKQKLILASASPRRKELLTTIGIKFDCEPADINEDPLPNEDCTQYVKRLAYEKALSIANKHKLNPCFVLGADTIVVLDQQLLGKPANHDQAFEYLSRLSGRTHTVLTGVCLLQGDQALLHEVYESQVTMHTLSAPEIRNYIQTGEPLDKAGAYAAQGIGKQFIQSITGSVNNVIGLPVELLQNAFKAHKISQ